jgi:two-component system phosphate regulon response regulator PhoB
VQVLVVDDDAGIREIVRRSIELQPESSGYQVIEVSDGAAALDVVASTQIDVVVLDLDLPDLSGLHLIERIHEHDPDIRVLVLTGATRDVDRVAGLMGGADDYVAKPFSITELAARVIALARRRAAPPPTVVTFGDLRIDVAARIVTRNAEEIDLTRREFDLLAHLATRPGHSFTRDELLRGAFTSSAEWQSAATITEHIRRLRLKIETDPANPTHLVTVRGLGYRFEPGESEDGETELLPSNARSSNEAMFVTVDAKVVFATVAALRLVGIDDRDEAAGRDPFDFVAPSSMSDALAQRRRVGEGRVPRPNVFAVTRRDGTVIQVEAVSTPVLWEDRPAMQITLWDLSDD